MSSLFDYNIPLQAYRGEDGKIDIVNYMPRKNRCSEMPMTELTEDEMSENDLFYGTAIHLMNLAKLFVEFAEGKRDSVYYFDEDIEKHFPPMPYEQLIEIPFKIKESPCKG